MTDFDFDFDLDFDFDPEAFRNMPLASAPYTGAPSFLYLMQCEHFTKVGIAASTQARRADLQRSNPFKVRILWSRQFEVKMLAMIAERGVHKLLAPWRHAGEWFTASPEQARAAISLVCAEMPAVTARHMMLDRERKLARLWRASRSSRRKTYTAEEEAEWQAHKAKVMGELFPPHNATQARACSR